MDPVRLLYLLQQVDANRITEAEQEELAGILFTEDRQDVVDVLQKNAETTSPLADLDPELFHPLLNNILQRKQRSPVVKMRWLKWAAAAAILVFASGIWWFTQNKTQKQAVEVTHHYDVAAPSGSHAIITLAGGQRVYLDSVANGSVAAQGSSQIIKRADGQVVYEAGKAKGGDAVQFNTLTNPRGSGVVDIILADGSRVWLNAGSAITYPVAFMGNERRVIIAGEAYFEVKHDAAKPFYVTKGDLEVRVLGTHFNINAYDDEPAIRTTLLEGKVSVESIPLSGGSGRQSAILKPGDQAVYSRLTIDDSRFTIDHSPDLDQVMAWKNGLFNFKSSDLRFIMNQIMRWYDVEVIYEGNQTIRLSGYVDRNLPLSETLQLLTNNGVKLRQEGKKIIMMQ